MSNPVAAAREAMDKALDVAVQAVRAAEARGATAVDARSDAEIKESIREMWQDELDFERERDKR